MVHGIEVLVKEADAVDETLGDGESRPSVVRSKVRKAYSESFVSNACVHRRGQLFKTPRKKLDIRVHDESPGRRLSAGVHGM